MKLNIESIFLVNCGDSEWFDVDSIFSNRKILLNRSEKVKILIHFSELNLGQKLYGNSKSESLKIQKSNCKKNIEIF